MNDIREKVKRFLVNQFPDGEAGSANVVFADDMDLQESGILDSFSTLNLVQFIEDEFQVELEQHDVESGRLLTLAQIERLVLDKQGSAR